MNAKIIALPIAAGIALGGASLATGADDPPPKPPSADRPALVAPLEPGIIQRAGTPFLPAPEPFGLHRDIAEDMAEELNLPADRVVDAMRKAIGAQFDRRRDEALKCFEDRKECEAAAVGELPPMLPGRPVPVRPGREEKP